MRVLGYSLVLCLMVLSIRSLAFAQDQQAAADPAQELAKKLSNPIASLVSFPIQFNYDSGYGSTDGSRLQINVQPVIPVPLSEKWNLISRTIMPVISQSGMFPGSGSQFGIGDVTQSVFFSPSAPTKSGLIWGAGPVLLLPTATDDLLGGEKWGAGPTFVVLKQTGPKTVGLLMNHVWSFAGDDDRADISATFIQPFYSYTTKTATTFGLNTEASYNWKTEDWSVPLNLTVSQLTRFAKQPVSVSAGIRYWLDSPDSGPEGFGLRLSVTYLFPK